MSRPLSVASVAMCKIACTGEKILGSLEEETKIKPLILSRQCDSKKTFYVSSRAKLSLLLLCRVERKMLAVDHFIGSPARLIGRYVIPPTQEGGRRHDDVNRFTPRIPAYRRGGRRRRPIEDDGRGEERKRSRVRSSPRGGSRLPVFIFRPNDDASSSDADLW